MLDHILKKSELGIVMKVKLSAVEISIIPET